MHFPGNKIDWFFIYIFEILYTIKEAKTHSVYNRNSIFQNHKKNIALSSLPATNLFQFFLYNFFFCQFHSIFSIPFLMEPTKKSKNS